MTTTITTLPNGLRVATDRMAESESVALGIWIGVGTRHEPDDASGLAHLVEHMLFKGTARRTSFQISAEMEDVGGYLNAFTGREETAYHCRVLPEHVGLGVDILSDMVRNATFDTAELERERAVIIQEIGQYYDTPDEHIFDLLQATAYPAQKMGRPILGTAETIIATPRQALFDYVQRHYCAANMLLVAAGKLEHAALVALAEKHLGDLPRGAAPAPNMAKYHAGTLHEPRALEQLHIALAWPGATYHDDDYIATQVLMTVLGGGMSSRLFQEVREKRGLVYAISAFNQAWHDTGLITIYAGTDPARATELLPVVHEELAKLAQSDASKGGITAAELARAKAQLRASVLMGQESSQTRCDQLAHQMLTYNRAIDLNERMKKLDAVTEATITRLATHLTATATEVRVGG
jgi:predicted Zn-dependent peptidase